MKTLIKVGMLVVYTYIYFFLFYCDSLSTTSFLINVTCSSGFGCGDLFLFREGSIVFVVTFYSSVQREFRVSFC